MISPVQYKGIQLDCGYRIDLLVEDVLIQELKSVDKNSKPNRLLALRDSPTRAASFATNYGCVLITQIEARFYTEKIFFQQMKEAVKNSNWTIHNSQKTPNVVRPEAETAETTKRGV